MPDFEHENFGAAQDDIELQTNDQEPSSDETIKDVTLLGLETEPLAQPAQNTVYKHNSGDVRSLDDESIKGCPVMGSLSREQRMMLLKMQELGEERRARAETDQQVSPADSPKPLADKSKSHLSEVKKSVVQPTAPEETSGAVTETAQALESGQQIVDNLKFQEQQEALKLKAEVSNPVPIDRASIELAERAQALDETMRRAQQAVAEISEAAQADEPNQTRQVAEMVEPTETSVDSVQSDQTVVRAVEEAEPLPLIGELNVPELEKAAGEQAIVLAPEAETDAEPVGPVYDAQPRTSVLVAEAFGATDAAEPPSQQIEQLSMSQLELPTPITNLQEVALPPLPEFKNLKSNSELAQAVTELLPSAMQDDLERLLPFLNEQEVNVISIMETYVAHEIESLGNIPVAERTEAHIDEVEALILDWYDQLSLVLRSVLPDRERVLYLNKIRQYIQMLSIESENAQPIDYMHELAATIAKLKDDPAKLAATLHARITEIGELTVRLHATYGQAA